MAGEISICASNFGTIIGIIGASAWLAPWVYQKLTKPIIRAKLISHFENKGEFNSTPCLLYFLTLNITSLGRNFNIKDTNISITYKNKLDKYTGKLFWARKHSWVGPDNKRLALNIPPEDTLPFVGTISKDITRNIYMTFGVDKAELDEIDDIQITFVEQSGCKSNVLIDFDMVDNDQMLWDDRIWSTE